ncbi:MULTISPECIES: 1,4-alpha-glucan branching enzyme [Kitasatospora]|uniref:1,4-alpha-glucan branching enzyme GlgB n=1 Tax=Kitasatospora setae (strain ATCC 33774 / DSM 43861 / JCM 3304 / KCC A-0304 / NBRC 14216 / KM-6054) TaxID=452652 RepID=E4NH64_KITSK|nr:1,4-alpha-glucan branching enzyme [Kitasatospora setae]BAJ30844.1 putative 1,4-alpha-glucan-branching enzyme [Kitasatospora setae KM-6054]
MTPLGPLDPSADRQPAVPATFRSGPRSGAAGGRPAAKAPAKPAAKSTGKAAAKPAAKAATKAPAKAARSGAAAARPQAGGGALRLPEAPLPPAEVERLVSGAHHDPHGLLGAHEVPEGTAVRVLRPFAERVVVETELGPAELTHQQDGLFTGLLTGQRFPRYTLRVAYPGGEPVVQEDGYRFAPTLGELDLHLIREGRHEQLWTALGSHLRTVDGVAGTAFAVWAPNAVGVRVIGSFNHWDGTAHPMRSLGSSGVWEVFLPGVGEGERYKYQILTRHGQRLEKADPLARAAQCPPDTASVVTVSRHEWQDAEWMERRARAVHHRAPLSVYELHLASWRPELTTYREIAEVLPGYLTELGFTHVEFMPVMEHPFGGSWGYQVSGFYAPTARLGTPDDFRFLVDTLHRHGIGVLVDWVPAHFPKDDFALARFDGEPLYEPADPLRAEHPDWGTLEFDYGRTEVRNFLVANAVYWCEEFHVDGLRVDAVASMLYLDYSREGGAWTPNQYGGRENLDAASFLQEMNATVYRRCPGVLTVAEESTAWDGVTRPTDSGGLGFGLKWNMGWMHDSLVYISKEPVHRRYHHDEITFSMVYAYSENYILPISHDEVVHGKRALVSKMPGDWWQQRANHRAYLGFMWAHPGKQLLFMGQEFAQGAEWDHESGPQWWVLDEGWPAHGDHRGVQRLVGDLNHVYRDTPALYEQDTVPAGFAWLDGGAAEDNVLSFVRFAADGSPLVAVCNFSPVVRHGFRVGLPRLEGAEQLWEEALNTDAERYGGGGVANSSPVKSEPEPWNAQPRSAELVLPPLATVWLRPAR